MGASHALTVGVCCRDPLGTSLPLDHARDNVVKAPEDLARPHDEFEGLPFPGAVKDGAIIKPASVVDLP